MASDSDTEEFFDAPEDVNLSSSPVVSPTKPGTFILKEEVIHSEHNGAQTGNVELKQDVSKEIIDSIIEESQKSIDQDDVHSSTEGKGEILQLTSASTSVINTEHGLLSNIPELVVTE
ncbi:WD repeat-containing protein 44-like, partial [Rhinophrynus dorsalis]